MFDGMFAATATQDLPASTVSQFTGISVHPGEDAAAKQETMIGVANLQRFIAKKTPPSPAIAGASGSLGFLGCDGACCW
eukprot:4272404-Prymnesium_polylepis.2